uniref:SXP/RAL-2 family protein Ani s 5-like cation-binding domain-containing protein n=1 Tax=Ditylenchus dipsaci TaxID=166011 RepID=A0A915CZW8_9BILA
MACFHKSTNLKVLLFLIIVICCLPYNNNVIRTVNACGLLLVEVVVAAEEAEVMVVEEDADVGARNEISGGGGGCGGGCGGCGGGCGGCGGVVVLCRGMWSDCLLCPTSTPPCVACTCGKRKKRSILEQQIKTHETNVCPQSSWKKTIVENIGEDAVSSQHAIQGAMFSDFENHKFFVNCMIRTNVKTNSTINQGELHKERENWANSQPADVQTAYRKWELEKKENKKNAIAHTEKIVESVSPETKALYEKIKAVVMNLNMTRKQECELIRQVMEAAEQKVQDEFFEKINMNLVSYCLKRSQPQSVRSVSIDQTSSNPPINIQPVNPVSLSNDQTPISNSVVDLPSLPQNQLQNTAVAQVSPRSKSYKVLVEVTVLVVRLLTTTPKNTGKIICIIEVGLLDTNIQDHITTIFCLTTAICYTLLLCTQLTYHQAIYIRNLCSRNLMNMCISTQSPLSKIFKEKAKEI